MQHSILRSSWACFMLNGTDSQDDLDAQLASEGTFGHDEELDGLFVAMQGNVNRQVYSCADEVSHKECIGNMLAWAHYGHLGLRAQIFVRLA